jgi:hypothetical protein
MSRTRRWAAAGSYHLDRARWSAAPGSLGVARRRAAIRGPRGRTHHRHRYSSGGTRVEARHTLPTSKRLAPPPVMRRIGIDEAACGLAGLPPVSGHARRWRWLRRWANELTHRSMLARKTVTSHQRRKSRLFRIQELCTKIKPLIEQPFFVRQSGAQVGGVFPVPASPVCGIIPL